MTWRPLLIWPVVAFFAPLAELLAVLAGDIANAVDSLVEWSEQ